MLPRHVYIHVPFCARRCSYCDFAIAVRTDVPIAEYLGALDRELELRVDRALQHEAQPWELDTLYFGGGTPSLLGVAGIANVLDQVRSRARLVPGAEVTIEANPDDVSNETVASWKDSGVTRISLGGQSFDDRVLRWMHRTHDARRLEHALDVLASAGLASWSFDLIFALPVALERSWERDLQRAIDYSPPHISLYGLTIEPSTPLARWRERGDVVEAPEEEYEAQYLLAHDRLRARDYRHYEVSSFARPGHESRHNQSYWTGVPYLGLGPAAHDFDGTRRRWNRPAYGAWLRALRDGHDPIAESELLTPENRVAEEVYLGLRTDSGLALLAGERELVRRWREAGWATVADGRVRLSAPGWLRLDSLAAVLTQVRSC